MANLPPLEMFKTAFRYLFGKTACKMYPKLPATSFETTRGHISFDPSTCILCTLCAKNCPTEALTVNREERYWRIDRLRCILCGECVERCPKNSITMEKTYAASMNARAVETIAVPE